MERGSTWKNKDVAFRELTEKKLKFLEDEIVEMKVEIARIGDKVFNRR